MDCSILDATEKVKAMFKESPANAPLGGCLDPKGKVLMMKPEGVLCAQRRGISELASAACPEGGPVGVGIANNFQIIGLHGGKLLRFSGNHGN